jgi:hypothetical protein
LTFFKRLKARLLVEIRWQLYLSLHLVLALWIVASILSRQESRGD